MLLIVRAFKNDNVYDYEYEFADRHLAEEQYQWEESADFLISHDGEETLIRSK